MNKYRNEKINEEMFYLEQLLTAISGKETRNLKVSEILKEASKMGNPEMSFDKATQMGMQQTANEAMKRLVKFATSFDRVTKMVEIMAEEMTANNLDNGQRYLNRLDILLEMKQ